MLIEATIILLLYLAYKWIQRRRGLFPPGPPKIPLLGSLPWMGGGKHFHLKIEEFRRKYGNIIGLKLGSRDAICVAGRDEIFEVLRSEHFQGRPRAKQWNMRTFNKPIGLFFADGPLWLEQRRFTIRHLRDFGFGRTSVEGMIHAEIEDFFENVLKEEKLCQVVGLFNISSVNVIWAMLGGDRFSHEDQQLGHLMELLRRFFRSGNTSGGLTVIFPFLLNLPFVKSGVEEVRQSTASLVKFLKETIEEHKRTKTNVARDFIDVYLEEMEVNRANFDEENLISNCMDLFSAGAESIGNTLSFCVLYLMLYPTELDLLREEIEQTIGQEKVTLSDASRLPKVEAFLSEVFRVSSIAPLTPPHRVTSDTSLQQYQVAEGTAIFINLYSIFHDKQIWGDPETFRPSRFLDSDGNYLRNPLLINFGFGRRVCPGEKLAKNFLSIFLTSLIQNYDMNLPEGHPRLSTKTQSGFTLSPLPFEVRFTKRN